MRGFRALALQLRGCSFAAADHPAAGLADLPHWAHWGAAIRARSEGHVRSTRQGAIVRYALNRRDLLLARRALAILGEMMLAAGAEEVAPGVSGFSPTVRDAAEMRTLTQRGPLYGPRKGHIAGAISFPAQNVLSGKGWTLADPDTLAERLAASGLSADQPVITYCGGGIAATTDAFALKLIGNDRVRIYDASLMEWSTDIALPMTDPSTTDDD